MYGEKAPEAQNKIYWETIGPEGAILPLMARWMVVDCNGSYRVLWYLLSCTVMEWYKNLRALHHRR